MATKMYSVKECREIMVWESNLDVYKVVCHRWFTDCHWMLRASKKKSGLWKVGKYIGTHIFEMDTFNGNHFDLDVDLISLVLIPHIKASIRYKIKEYVTSVHQQYECTITKRKAYLGRKRAFEIVYGDWDNSFASLPRYVFWAFKPAIDDFVHCRPVISIYGTHVYGKYDIKLLIAVVVDANGQIFPLDFSIYANESQKTWMLFLNHLKQHVVKQLSGMQIQKAHGIDSSARGLPVIAIVRMSFKQMAERFVERHRGVSELMERSIELMPIPMKRIEKYRRRAH
uniref:Uncharacterized protein LOC104212830 n=1 Tax=Nicotiana sylvestris TaxID=4096 RepID=A0A1U7VDV8_NICSY|nr:PREDICTED: uncharacterized protein LOC104212830 [Nicotiana sylvestris]